MCNIQYNEIKGRGQTRRTAATRAVRQGGDTDGRGTRPFGSLLLELRRGTLVLSVLSQMDVPRYGYSLVQCMEEKGVAIDPNTLYPLLRRLERQGLLESRWETDGPKPRKYYTRTPFGDEIFEALKRQWREMAAGVEGLLKKESRAACEAPRTGEGRRNDEPG